MNQLLPSNIEQPASFVCWFRLLQSTNGNSALLLNPGRFQNCSARQTCFPTVIPNAVQDLTTIVSRYAGNQSSVISSGGDKGVLICLFLCIRTKL